MSFAAGRFVDSGREREFSAGTTDAPGPACREAAGATCRSSSRLASEARGQPSPKELEIIAIADIALKPQALGATEDLLLAILVVPLFPPGIPAGLHQPGFSGLASLRSSIIRHY
jgi:hypothetical protein